MRGLRYVLADNLRRLRQEAGLTQVAASKLIGYGDAAGSFLRRYERADGNPTLSTLERFAAFYETTVPDLLVDRGPAKAPAGEKPSRFMRLDVLEREVAELKHLVRRMQTA